MMVERRHLEYALAVAELEVADLNYVGQSLDDIHDAESDEYQRHIVREGHGGNGSAEEQGAGVAHKHLCGVEIIHKEADEAARETGCEYAEFKELLAPRNGNAYKEQAHGNGGAAGKAVHAVGYIHGVDRSDDYKCREHEIQPLRHGNSFIEERDIEVRSRVADAAHQQHENQCCRELEQELFACGQAEVLLLLELFPVVQKADRAEH